MKICRAGIVIDAVIVIDDSELTPRPLTWGEELSMIIEELSTLERVDLVLTGSSSVLSQLICRKLEEN